MLVSYLSEGLESTVDRQKYLPSRAKGATLVRSRAHGTEGDLLPFLQSIALALRAGALARQAQHDVGTSNPLQFRSSDFAKSP